MYKIKNITKLEKRKKTILKEMENIEIELQKEYNKYFDTDKTIENWVKLLEISKNYVFDEYGDICQWIKIDILSIYINSSKYLNEYLLEYYYCSLDFENFVLTSSGDNECFIINHEGDIFFNDTCIICKNDYTSEENRNFLIENYMEKIGIYCNVFLSDYYSNLTLIDTTNKLRKLFTA